MESWEGFDGYKPSPLCFCTGNICRGLLSLERGSQLAEGDGLPGNPSPGRQSGECGCGPTVGRRRSRCCWPSHGIQLGAGHYAGPLGIVGSSVVLVLGFSMDSSRYFQPFSSRVALVSKLVWTPAPSQFPAMRSGSKVAIIPKSSQTRHKMKRATQR